MGAKSTQPATTSPLLFNQNPRDMWDVFMKSIITASVEQISPDTAELWLKSNTNNFRKPDHKRVALYSRDMELGKWEVNGETITFDSNGLLSNGQHRLESVVKSGVTIESVVVRGISPKSINIDRGKSRSVGQILASLGVPNASSAAPLGRAILMHNDGRWVTGDSGCRQTDNEIVDFVMANPERINAAVNYASRCKHLIPRSILSPVLYIGSISTAPINAHCDWFCSAISAGKDIAETDGAYHLRNKIISQTESKKISPTALKAAVTVAWNRSVLGEPCSAKALSFNFSGPNKSKMPNSIECLPASEEK